MENPNARGILAMKMWGYTGSMSKTTWMLTKGVSTHRSKSNSRGSQTYQATVSRMRLMDSVRIVVAKLIDDGSDPGVVLRSDKLAYDAFEPITEFQV